MKKVMVFLVSIVFLPVSFISNSVSCITTTSESTVNSVIPKRIAEQRISNGFLQISVYFDGNCATYIISLSWIVQSDGWYVSLFVSVLIIVGTSFRFMGVTIVGLVFLLSSSSSSLKQMTIEIVWEEIFRKKF
jgi:hypothetical protein